jgi:hypothetical protein
MQGDLIYFVLCWFFKANPFTFVASINNCSTEHNIMAEGNNKDWGKKGWYIGVFFVALITFAILWIWVYGMNQNGLG